MSIFLATLLLCLPFSSWDRQDSGDDPGKESEKAPPQEGPEEPGPRRAIAGLSSIQYRSTITMASDPRLSAESVVTFVFPDRAHLRIEPVAEKVDPLQRRIQYRWGSQQWVVLPGASKSKALEGQEHRQGLLQLALRRVLLTWPAELEWQGTGEVRTAKLPDFGKLVVAIDPATGRPSRIESEFAEGRPLERLAKIRWRKDGKRYWPISWTLFVEGREIWSEKIEVVRPGARFLDSFFKPLDQRDLQAGDPASTPRETPFPPRVIRTRTLPEGAGWDRAFALAKEETATWTERLKGGGYPLDSHPTFQIDRRGRPTAIELRLKGLPEKVPEGWRRVEGGRGLTQLLPGLSALEGGTLDRLFTLVPRTSRAGTPYVRVRGSSKESGMVRLVLPLLPGK
jgi:hypothetical protein